MSYSGFTVEQLLDGANDENGWLELLKTIDYLVDGKFVIALKSYECHFRGSTNQRIIDVQRTLKENHVVTCEL